MRRFLHLLLLLLIFGFVIGALRGSVPKIPLRAALVIQPQGEIVEQLSGEPLERALQQAQGGGRAQTLLWDLIDCVRAAKTDSRIPVIVLDFRKFGGAGQPVLEELARALRDFRTSGKKIIAYGTEILQNPYYLAAQADEIYVDPLGGVFIDGYDRYQMYLKDALDKLGVDINIFRVGKFKSAVEPFSRKDMSPEDREESKVYLDSLWASWQGAVTRARRLEPGAVARYVDSFVRNADAAGGNLANVALQSSLVTGIKSGLEVERRIAQLVGMDEDKGTFNQVSAEDYVRVVRATKKVKSVGKPRIGVVVASGEILDGDQPSGTIGGSSTAELIREARLDDGVKALVLRVDSPGGSVLASEQIYREVAAVRESGKPVIVSMGNYAASGGYYIASGADEIWASPATITGSIGIFAIVPTINRTLDKLGIGVDGIGTTPLSGQARIDRPLSPEARTLLQAVINHGYEEFLTHVASGRNKTRDQINEIAQGRVWTGVDAQKIGLIDKLGGYDDAVKAAAARAKVTNYDVEIIQPELSWAQQLAMQINGWGMKLLAAMHLSFGGSPFGGLLGGAVRGGWGGGAPGALGGAQAMLPPGVQTPLLREAQRISRFTQPNHLYAYCFCTVE